MAEQAPRKAEAKESAASAPAATDKKAEKSSALKCAPIMLGAVMLIEAVVLFAGFKFLGGGPKAVQGADLSHGEGVARGHDDGHGGHGAAPAGHEDKRKLVEVELPRSRPINSQCGRRVMYDLQIVIRAKSEHIDKIKQAIKDNDALIRDRIRIIVAQTDPEKLGGGAEPGLETLRRQVKYQLDEIIGEGMIDEVLAPVCIPYPMGF